MTANEAQNYNQGWLMNKSAWQIIEKKLQNKKILKDISYTWTFLD